MSDKQLLDGIEWPKFSDGKLVKIGSAIYLPDLGVVDKVSSIRFGASLVVIETEERHFFQAPYGLTIKRPPVLDKDGIEIKVGDTVWDTQGTQCVVESINRYGADRPLCECTYKYEGCAARVHKNPCILTHTPPDSWEKLREDTKKFFTDYWGCRDFSCGDCPSTIGEETPGAHYECDCTKAQRLDILTRAEKLAGVMDDE